MSVSYVTSPQTASEAVLQTFSNATPIHHHEGVSGSPYPSVITVPTLAGPVQKVTANLIFDQFGTAGSLDVLLVGPHGQKVLLLSDVDGTTGFPAPSVTFDDDAPPLPATTTLTGSTTCAPTNYNPPGDTDAFAKPAPPPPYSNSLGVFKGLDPVGDWKLYVMRGGSVSSLYDGAIQQWFLTFQTEGDYVRTAGTLTIPAGTQTGVVVVPVIGDPLVEPDETFSLDLGTPTGATIGSGHAVGTVLNDDTFPEMSIGDATIAEQNLGFRRVDFTVTLSKPGYLPAIVDYTTQDGTATSASGDYVPAAGTLTVAPGATTGHITVLVRGDLAVEANDTFSVALSSPVHATLTDAQGVATITNDDVPGHFQFSAPVYNIGEGAGSATVMVRRLGGAGGGATVDYSAVDGTAIGAAGSSQDYQPTSGTLTFAAGQTALAFKVPIVRDLIHEGTETVLLHLRNPQPSAEGATLGTPSLAVMNILDDDLSGRIRLSSATYAVAEGAGSVKIAAVRVGGNATPVTVHYETSPRTASGGGIDYGDASGDLTFASSGLGAIVQTVTIPITQDLVAEGAESFDVTLSSPSGGATLASPSVATVTIIDDERTVEFSSSTYSAKESQRSALVTLRRSGPLDGVATVDYATGDPADTAAAGADYKPTAGTVTFPPFVSTRYLVIPILPDALVEGPETVTLSLGHPTGLALGETNRAVLTILDDDTAPVVEFAASAYAVNEAAPSVLVLVKRTGTLADAVLVDYAATGGSATNAPDPAADYDLAPGTLTFGKGVAIRTIAIPIVRDTLDEGTETVELSLSNPRNVDDPGHVSLGPTSQTTVRIIDNEPTVQFAAAAYTVGEAARSMSIPVFRTGLGQAGSVAYDVVGGSAVRDTGSGGDYAIHAPGTLTFGPTEWYKTLPIVLDPDTVADGSKTIALALSAPSGAQLGSPSTTLITIRDDDTAGRVQFASASYVASESATAATVTVTRVGGTSSEATVRYTIAAGASANPAAPGDFDAGSGTLTFGAHELSKTFVVPVHDNLVPDSGAVSVDLLLDTPGGGLALGPQSVATLWIVRE